MKRQVTITSMFNKTGKADHEESICESAESKKQRYDSNDTDSEISGSDSSEDLDFEEFEGETVQIGETGEFMMQGKVHVHVTAAVILHMFLTQSQPLLIVVDKVLYLSYVRQRVIKLLTFHCQSMISQCNNRTIRLK